MKRNCFLNITNGAINAVAIQTSFNSQGSYTIYVAFIPLFVTPSILLTGESGLASFLLFFTEFVVALFSYFDFCFFFLNSYFHLLLFLYEPINCSVRVGGFTPCISIPFSFALLAHSFSLSCLPSWRWCPPNRSGGSGFLNNK